MAVDNKGLCWSWGINSMGELGVGDNDPRVHPYPVLTLKGKQVTSISCGNQFVIALGSKVRKEIPNLNLSKNLQKEKEIKKQRKLSMSKKSSHSRKRNSSVSKLSRKNSQSYGSSFPHNPSMSYKGADSFLTTNQDPAIQT